MQNKWQNKQLETFGPWVFHFFKVVLLIYFNRLDLMVNCSELIHICREMFFPFITRNNKRTIKQNNVYIGKFILFNFHHIYNLFDLKPQQQQKMIQTIVRNCTRAIYHQKANSFLNLNTTKYYFSTENVQQPQQQQKQKRLSRRQQQQQQASDFSPMDYYRNTIRRVNIRSNGRGKFTPYFLQKIINMSSTEEHAKIMYEAYYNYLGHFTLIPNAVVDELVFKSITIGNQVDKVMEIFSNHNYLTYFPHYDATLRFIKHLVQISDNVNLEKFMRILIRSPLIKINNKIASQLIEIGSNAEVDVKIKELALKVLIYRKKLVDGMSQVEVVAKVAAMLEGSEMGPLVVKNNIRALVQELLAQPAASHDDTLNRLVLASTFSMIEQSAALIAKEQKQINSQYDRLFEYLLKLAPRTAEQVNFGTVLKEALAQAKLSIGATEKIQQIINAKTVAEPQAQQTQ